MRTMFLSFLALLLPAVLAAAEAKPLSFFARSPHYSMAIEMQPNADGTTDYNVTVVDLATNTVVAQPHLKAPAAETVSSETFSGAMQFRVRVRPVIDANVSVDLDVMNRSMMVDQIRTFWMTGEPKRLVGTVTGGVVPPLPPGYYHVCGDVRAPQVITRVEPVYNETARKDRVSGIAIVQAMIDETGKVREAMILRNLPDGLGQAAADAVSQWQFSPALRDGKPVPVVFNLTVNFKLDSPPPQP